MSKVPQITYVQLDLMGHAKIVGFTISSLLVIVAVPSWTGKRGFDLVPFL